MSAISVEDHGQAKGGVLEFSKTAVRGVIPTAIDRKVLAQILSATAVGVYKGTPGVCAGLLAYNTENFRKFNPVHAATLGRLMRDGLWRSNGDSIRLTTRKTLGDGQHRLHAAAVNGVTIDLIIVPNVSDAALLTVDTGGRTRDAGQALSRLGYKSASSISAMVTAWIQVEAGLIAGEFSAKTTSYRPSNQEVVDFVSSRFGGPDAPVLDSMLQLYKKFNRSMKGSSPASFVATHRLFSLFDAENADKFFEGIAGLHFEDDVGGNMGAAYRAIAVLARKPRNPTHAFRELPNILARGFEGFRKGDTTAIIKQLQISDSGVSPFKVPPGIRQSWNAFLGESSAA